MTRLVVPEAYGVMALVQVMIIALGMISDVGLIPNIIQSKRGDDPDYLNTAWTIQLIRGVMLFVLGSAFAPLFASYYESPELSLLIPVALLGALLDGFQSTKMAIAGRELLLERVIAVEVVSKVLSMIPMVVLGLIYRNVWALVIGGVAYSLCRMILSHFMMKGPFNKLRMEREAARAILTFGGWIFVSTLITFLATRIDVLILGKLLDKKTLGIYQIALMLAFVPTQIGGRLASSVLLPAFAESYRETHEKLQESFHNARQALLRVGLLLIIGAALVAVPFFYFLYDSEYFGGGWMMQLLLISVWFNLLQENYGRACLAMGKPKILAAANLVKVFFVVGASFAGHHWAALPGFIIGIGAGAFAGHLVIVWALAQDKLYTLKDDLTYSVLGAVLILAGVFGAKKSASALGIHEAYTSIVMTVVVVGGYAWVASLPYRARIASMWGKLRSKLKPSTT